MTHREHERYVRPAVPCSANHITFGGRCLNCGFDPHYCETAADVQHLIDGYKEGM